MAGIRFGTVYSENRDVVEALAKMGSFHGVSGTTQHQMAQLLQDRGWCICKSPNNNCYKLARMPSPPVLPLK